MAKGIIDIMIPNELDIADQILALSEIDWNKLQSSEGGLCTALAAILENMFNLELYDIRLDCISEYIPIFTKKNAMKFGASTDRCYWWPRDSKGYSMRIKFVDWMIEELCKKINK